VLGDGIDVHDYARVRQEKDEQEKYKMLDDEK